MGSPTPKVLLLDPQGNERKGQQLLNNYSKLYKVCDQDRSKITHLRADRKAQTHFPSDVYIEKIITKRMHINGHGRIPKSWRRMCRMQDTRTASLIPLGNLAESTRMA